MKTDKFSNYYWHLGLASLAIGGAIALVCDRASAQITPDSTLGSENSVVTPNIDINGSQSDRIDGGAIRGANLFHSFGEFNIGEGQKAYFTNPVGIENILSRVTGSNPSNILGTLGVLGNANLFLINPNGIVFGSNAQLDFGGSFVGTTANAIEFGDIGIFSASAPNAPTLLTVNPSALLFNSIAAQSIANSSKAPSEKLDPSDVFGLRQMTGLQVPDGKSLLLVGGNVNLDGGGLNALGGRVELGGVAEPGTVGLNVDGNNLSLSFPEFVERADVRLANEAFVSVTGGGGGNIAVNARNVDLTNSQLRAGIGLGLGTVGSQAGDITLNATGAIAIAQGDASISNQSLGIGNAGDIKIATRSLFMTDNAKLVNIVEEEAEGDVGNISVLAKDSVSLEGNSGIILTPPPNFSDLQAGNGNVFVQANNSVSFTDSRIVTSSWGGNAGNISVKTNGFVSLIDSSLGSTTYGQGSGGKITVQADGSVNLANSTVSNPAGDPGTPAQGDAGGIDIQARSISITEGTELSSRAYGNGNAGNIQLAATDFIEISGDNPLFPKAEHLWSPRGKYSSVLTSTEEGATGQGGNISITTGNLGVSNGGILNASSRSTAKGGNIAINANGVEVTSGGQILTTAFSSGDAGKIDINASDRVTISGTNRSILEVFKQFENPSTLRQDNDLLDPKIEYLIPHVIPANGVPASGLFANTSDRSTGRGGDLKITTGQLDIRDGAEVNANSEGRGNAGNLEVTAGSIRLDNKSALTAATRSGNGGNITLQVQDLLLMRHNSQISSTAGTAKAGGDGGNININAELIVALENSDIAANAFQGRGGNVQISTSGLFLSPESQITASSERGIDGVVEIRTPDVELQNSLTQLAANFVSPDRVVAGSCLARRNVERGSFTVTGTGGLPSSPYEAMDGKYETSSIQSLQGSSNAAPKAAVVETAPWKRGEPIREAQGMVVTANGRTLLGTTSELVSVAKAKDLICQPK